MDKVRFGVIGLGNQGRNYILGLFDGGKIVPEGVVTAACDLNPAKIDALKKDTLNKDITYFSDYKEMLDSGLCDVILVETPHYQHPEIVMACLERGLNVICDKPAGVYTKQVRQMNEFAKGKNGTFM